MPSLRKYPKVRTFKFANPNVHIDVESYDVDETTMAKVAAAAERNSGSAMDTCIDVPASRARYVKGALTKLGLEYSVLAD